MLFLFVASFQLLSIAGSTYTDIYNFPMFGILMYGGKKDTSIAYGSVTLVQPEVVICAAENLLQLDPKGTAIITDKKVRDQIYIYTGSDLLHPPDWFDEAKIQKIPARKIYVAKNTRWVSAIDKKALEGLPDFVLKYQTSAELIPDINSKNAEDVLRKKGYAFNPFHELQWDVALIIVDTAFKYTPYTLPVANFNWNEPAKVAEKFEDAWDAIEAVEQKPLDLAACTIPGWSPMGNNEVIYHTVVYVRFKECEDALCGTYPSSCLLYLNKRHHVCFKSTNFADPCFIDQGAPVLCPWFPDKVVGVLTKTFDCGAETLPSIVTRIDAITVFASLLPLASGYIKENPRLDDAKYTVPPDI